MTDFRLFGGWSAGLFSGGMMLSLLLGGSEAHAGITISAASASRVDVGSAVSSAKDGDTVIVPAGSATWTTTLTVTKNISLIGAGEGRTVITENLPRSSSPPLFQVSLGHDSAAPAYSFRLSGFTLKSTLGTQPLASEHAIINLTGNSSHVASPTVANPAPQVLGCVSRVRLDHMTWDNLNGLNLLVNSCLGVADHITQLRDPAKIPYDNPVAKVYHVNWTPAVDPATGAALPVSYKATKAFGSWADDSYWGTNKFWFFEDCNFTVSNNTNTADDEEGARVVWRHCTFNGGGGLATHGMEGRAQPGIKQHEIYNNYFVTNRLFGNHRSGSVLYFNNKSTAMTTGVNFFSYRQSRTEANWGAADGNCRYDKNGPLVYSGQITAVGPGFPNVSSVSDASRADFNLIDLSDGSSYSINDLDDVKDNTADAGWKTYHTTITSVSGKTLNLKTDNAPTGGQYTALWAVGDRYEIRRVMTLYGQPGQGKGNLLNAPGSSSYDTYTYPATSGPKAIHPQAGYPLDPCYSWNNTDNVNGYLGFPAATAATPRNTSLKAGRDYFNLPERSIVTQKVGYPEQSYSRATSNYPKIGPGQTVDYAPYTYPHPLTLDGGASPTAPEAPSNLKIVPGQ